MPIATDITLNEETHTYTDSNGVEFTSVSKIIGRYKEPFDQMAIAAKTAKKTGKTVDQILAIWGESAPYGTAVHKQIEDYFTGNGDRFDLIQPYLYRFSEWKKQPAKFHPETILYHPELKIAGTADMLVERSDGTWSILDWKTNKAIYKTSFGGKKLRGKLNHLDDCNHVHYSLQLSLYAAMLGTEINKLNLIHIPKDKASLDVIPCPYLEREIDIIFNELYDEKAILPF